MDTHTISFKSRNTTASQPPRILYPADTPETGTRQDISRQFVLILAHEIRNPLNNINLSTEILASEITDERLKIYLEVLKRNTKRINDLVNTLLKYQQGEEKGVEKQSMHQLLEEVLLMAGDRIALREIVVIKEYDERDCVIVLNKQKIMIALTNIIVNAIDAMAKGKGVLKLTTRSRKYSYTIQIEDNGCGISQTHLDKIFKPFFTNKPGGLGFGLAATYGILQSNNVGVNVESEEGKGTRFTLLFHKNSLISSRNICAPYG